MKHTRTSLFMFVLPLLLSPAAFTGCGSKVTESVVTETGNPPFINGDGIATQALAGKITVTGRSGATSPNATVLLRDLTNGDSTTEQADADGAFTATVTGEAADELKLTVTVGGETTELIVSAGTPDAETDAGASPGASSQAAPPSGLECQQLAQTDSRYTDFLTAARNADTACSKDEDCGEFKSRAWCDFATCTSYAVSSSAMEGLEAQATALIDGLCADLTEQGCTRPSPTSNPPSHSCPASGLQYPYGVGCIEGTCGALPDPDPTPQTCEEIADGAFALIPGLEASGSCEQDADCVAVAKATACIPRCDYYVTSAAAADGAAADLTRLNTEVCASLTAASCDVPYNGFLCPPIVIEPPTPVCIDNLCVAK
jgi:hypothetical protein